MALSDGDKAIIKETAWEVGEMVSKRIEQRLDERIKVHQLSCPASNAVKRTKALLVGVGIGAALAGAGGTFAALKWLSVL